MKKVFKKAVGLFTALGLSMAAGAFPAMAQGDVYLNPDAVRKLKDSGQGDMTIPAAELFIGFDGCTATQLVDAMLKYGPDDWQIAWEDDFLCEWNPRNDTGYFGFMFTYVNRPSWSSSTEPDQISTWRAEQRMVGDQIWLSATSGINNNQVWIYGRGEELNKVLQTIERVNNAAGVVSTGSSSTAAATPAMPQAQASWKSSASGWWYDNGDGTWPANTWMWIEGKCYYFDGNGYLLTNTTTPDNYQVNGNGEWVVNGMVQTQ